MRFLFLALILSGSLLRATSVAVTQQTLTFHSSCSAGAKTASPCPPGGLTGDGYQAVADTGSGLYPPPTLIPGGQMVSVWSDASTLYHCDPIFGCPPFVPLWGTANASDTINGRTTGPNRVGWIQFSLIAGWTNDNSGTRISMKDGLHSYGIGDGAPPNTIDPSQGGSYDAKLPFELGTGFQVSASVAANSPCPTSEVCGTYETGTAALSFILLEPDGTPIPFVSAPGVPEPSTCMLLFLGLTAGAGFMRKR